MSPFFLLYAFFISLDLLYFRLRSCNGFTPLCLFTIFKKWKISIVEDHRRIIVLQEKHFSNVDQILRIILSEDVFAWTIYLHKSVLKVTKFDNAIDDRQVPCVSNDLNSNERSAWLYIHLCSSCSIRTARFIWWLRQIKTSDGSEAKRTESYVSKRFENSNNLVFLHLFIYIWTFVRLI